MKSKISFKKVLSLLLAVMMIVATVPVAFAAEYDETQATKFTFSNDKIEAVKGKYDGYKIEKTALSIKNSGTYILSGECSDGSITVKKGVKDVTLVFDGLNLTSSDTAPLTCNKSSEVKIVAKDGSVNTFVDSKLNNDDNYPENENAENAVFKFKDGTKIELCGTGSISIVSNGKNGIKAGATTEAEGEASLTIRDLKLDIDVSVNDGINAESLLDIKSGEITVSALDDGIHSDYVLNIGQDGTTGPTIRVNKSYEGLEGANITVYSGDVEIHSTDDGINAANSDLKDYKFSMDFPGGKTVVYADNGDGVDSNGSLTVSGGTLFVFTGNKADNQPLDADGEISIISGTVLAAGASAGMGTKIKATQPYVQYGSSRMNPLGMLGGMTSKQQSKLSSSISVKKGQTLSIKNASGETLVSCEAPYDITSVIFSSPDLVIGENCTLFSGSDEVATKACGNGNCSCLCHKDGIGNIVWKIVLIFSRILGINKTCTCGAAHY